MHMQHAPPTWDSSTMLGGDSDGDEGDEGGIAGGDCGEDGAVAEAADS